MNREEWLQIHDGMTREQFDALPDWKSNFPQTENIIYKFDDGMSIHRHQKENEDKPSITIYNEAKRLNG